MNDADQPSRRSPRQTRELANDNGGAIIVVGTFMAIFLTAAMFFIMGTGEAIVYRERVQDAADAIAFSSAGIHARGMNMIVLINMLMAAILAVLVALKMLQVITIILTTVACIIAAFCAIGVGCWAVPPCEWGLQFAPKLQNAISKYEQVVKKVLPALSFLQRVVAWTTPYVALAKSPGVAQKYEPLVTGGLMISPSMVPCVPGGCDDGKIGLPVSEDDYANLCSKAGEYVVKIAFFWLPDFIQGAIEKLAGWVAGTFPGYFCAGGGVDGGASGLDGAGANLKDLAAKACEEQEKMEKKKYEDQNDGSSDGFDFDMDKCKKDREEEFKGKIDDQLGQEGAAQTAQGGLDPDKMTPKKVYDQAKHGGFYFQVFGFANAEADWPRRTDKGILIATSAGGMNVPSNMFTAMRFAQAEFYFDKAGEWDDVNEGENAMWELAWRARLRRIRPMAPNLGEFSFDFATGKLTDLIGSQITQKLMDGDIFKFIMGEAAFGAAQEWLTGKAGELGGELDKIIDSKLQFTSWEVIH